MKFQEGREGRENSSFWEIFFHSHMVEPHERMFVRHSLVDIDTVDD